MVRFGRSGTGMRSLLLLFLLLRIALLADLVFLGRFRTTLVTAFLALSDSLVAAGGVRLAFCASLFVFMRLHATLVFAILTCGLSLDTTALVRQDGAGTQH